ncbi:hypothetical protein [Apibacter sp. HY039]|uniref:hypothetical protein n=1 Tax=Apibacter sp. HY039 TaxID=2501476 RepID=UPI000FEBA0EA|nr:hypothetical protein [Apibacter sp. HY039]
MYLILKNIHHYTGMAVLIFVLLLTVVSFIYFLQKRTLSVQVRKISLITLILTHIQVLIGIALLITYFSMSQISFKEIMPNAVMRRNYVEHPTSMVIVAILITIFNSKLKKVQNIKVWMLIVMALSLALVISMIPRVFWSTLLP